MSLTRFITLPDVRDALKRFRPKQSRKIPVPLHAEPTSNRYMLVGTAFDYLLRFEIQRRAPHAVSSPWIAERSLDRIRGGYILLPPNVDPTEDNHQFITDTAKRAFNVVETAKTAVTEYAKNHQPNLADQALLASDAIRLARMDPVYRGQPLDPAFEEVAQEDIDDLLNMLAIVPFDALLDAHRIMLNPTFGAASEAVGGADCDLISGDTLIDLKTTKKEAISPKDLDQLLGYFLLTRHVRRAEIEHRAKRTEWQFPPIERVGLYFSRHGYLWTFDVTTWTTRKGFCELEEWFFKRAKEVSGNRYPSSD